MSAVYYWFTVKVVLFEISSQAGKSNNCEPQQTLPPRQGGDLQDVCGVPPQGPSEEALQGGRWYRCWQPGHSSEQQGGVLATSSTEHQDSKGIWETIPQLLSNLCMGRDKSEHPLLLRLRFCF